MSKLKEMLDLAVQSGASDLHLAPGSPPLLRVDGRLRPIGAESLDEHACRGLCGELCPAERMRELEARGTADFAITHGDGQRFRVSVLRQRGGLSAVLRLIPSRLLSLEEIGLPRAA